MKRKSHNVEVHIWYYLKDETHFQIEGEGLHSALTLLPLGKALSRGSERGSHSSPRHPRLDPPLLSTLSLVHVRFTVSLGKIGDVRSSPTVTQRILLAPP